MLQILIDFGLTLFVFAAMIIMCLIMATLAIVTSDKCGETTTKMRIVHYSSMLGFVGCIAAGITILEMI